MWDRYQQAVFENMRSGEGNTVVIARAGSGKTTTAVQGLNELPAWGTVLLTSFSRQAVADLTARAPRHVRVRGLHSIGYETLRRHRSGITVDNYKGHRIASDVLRDAQRQNRSIAMTPENLKALKQLVGLAKNNLARDLTEVVALGVQHGLETRDFDLDDAAPLVAECMRRAADSLSSVDYDDQIYLPAKLGLQPLQADFVIADELQDMNIAQLWLTGMSTRRRFFGIGDPLQAIYLFRGADVHAIPRVVYEMRAQQLPLSITYRCSRAVVDYVKSKTPGLSDFEAAPSAPDGAVLHESVDDMFVQAAPGDFVLSRLNAPLLPICLQFLRQGRAAVIAGRDIGRDIVRLVEQSHAETPRQLCDWLNSYRSQAWLRLSRLDRMDQYAEVHDQVDVLMTLADMHTSIAGITQQLNTLFVDDRPEGVIVCSSVHKAKGLERDRVWLLEDSFRLWDSIEESNIYYVACTRARQTLCLVTGSNGAGDGIRLLTHATSRRHERGQESPPWRTTKH